MTTIMVKVGTGFRTWDKKTNEMLVDELIETAIQAIGYQNSGTWKVVKISDISVFNWTNTRLVATAQVTLESIK